MFTYGNLLRNSYQNPLELGLENSLSIYIWNPSGIRSKINKRLVGRAPGHFTYGILKESLSKSIGNWSGELLVNLRQFPIDFKKYVWRVPGQFTCGNLKEFLSKSFGNLSGKLLVNLHMESLRNPFQHQLEFGLESSCSLYTWNPYGLPFKIHRKLVWRAPGPFTHGILLKV